MVFGVQLLALLTIVSVFRNADGVTTESVSSQIWGKVSSSSSIHFNLLSVYCFSTFWFCEAVLNCPELNSFLGRVANERDCRCPTFGRQVTNWYNGWTSEWINFNHYDTLNASEHSITEECAKYSCNAAELDVEWLLWISKEQINDWIISVNTKQTMSARQVKSTDFYWPNFHAFLPIKLCVIL